MQRLAELAGVSKSTVSRALSDSPLISSKTKEKIQQLAQEHRFVLNEAGRNLRLKRSSIICVVLMHDPELSGHLSDPFFMGMVGSIADNLAKFGHDLMLYHKPLQSAAEYRAARVYRQCDGTIFVGQGMIHGELNKLAKDSKPIVVWGADLPSRDYAIVGADNLGGGRAATEHLINRGCERLAFFGDTQKPELALRHRGYVQALEAHGCKVDAKLEIAVPMDPTSAETIIEAFIKSRPDIDGIVCCSDMLAASAVSCLQRYGLRVPADVAVTGYDNLEIGARINPTLTTVSQGVQDAGEKLVRILMAKLAGNEQNDIVNETLLVVRESSRR